jgi:hypothetical protein
MVDRETDVARYGMRAGWGIDNTPAFNDLVTDAMESNRRVFRFGPGEYQFFSAPQLIRTRGIEFHATARNATVLARRFTAAQDHIGVFNFDEEAWGSKLSGFMMVGREECAGTGSMVSLVTKPAPEGVAGFCVEYCRFTSNAPGGAFKYYLHLDGSNGGAAETPRIRGFELVHNEFFGHVAGGACMNFVSVMSGMITGGWCTPGTDPVGKAYPAAAIRFDGGPGEYAQTQNMRVDITGAYTVDFVRAKSILMDAPYITDLRRKSGCKGISVRCPTVLSQSGGWSGQEGCWWRQS